MTQKFNTYSAQQLAKCIREKRLSQGMTLIELGSCCGVHHSQLSRIEHGKVVYVSKNMEKVCRFLQIGFEEINHDQEVTLISRVERMISTSTASARAIESLVTALEELTVGQSGNGE